MSDFTFLLWLQKLPVEIWMKIIEYDSDIRLRIAFYYSIVSLPKACPYVSLWKSPYNDNKYGSFKILIKDDYRYDGSRDITKSIYWSECTADDTQYTVQNNYIEFTTSNRYKYQQIVFYMYSSDGKNSNIEICEGTEYFYGDEDFYSFCTIVLCKNTSVKKENYISETLYPVYLDPVRYYPEETNYKYYRPIDFIMNFSYQKL